MKQPCWCLPSWLVVNSDKFAGAEVRAQWQNLESFVVLANYLKQRFQGNVGIFLIYLNESCSMRLFHKNSSHIFIISVLTLEIINLNFSSIWTCRLKKALSRQVKDECCTHISTSLLDIVEVVFEIWRMCRITKGAGLEELFLQSVPFLLQSYD